MRALVVGAGIIGSLYAAKLVAAGHEVTVVARGHKLTRLRALGVRVNDGGAASSCPVRAVDRVPTDEFFDVTLLAVRADQLSAATPEVALVNTAALVVMGNIVSDAEEVRAALGAERTVLGFPGVGGYWTPDGTIRYLDIRQQPTIVARTNGTEGPFVSALRHAGLAVDLTGEIEDWLTTHAIFILGIGAAILASGGDSTVLGRDRRATARMVEAIGDAFSALRHAGVTVTPRALRTIFTRVPRFIAARYWGRQLRGDLGTVTLAPHVRATQHSELPVLAAQARDLLGNRAPRYQELLRAAHLEEESHPG